MEHNPVQILESQLFAVREAMNRAEISVEEIAAIGITNQRETTVAWDAKTGIPVCNAIVWQCRRTAELCEAVSYTHLSRGWKHL